MKRETGIRLALALSIILTCGTQAFAQEKYPSRPIDMIVNFGPGGGADGLGRNVARTMEKILKVPVPASNVAGAAGNTGLTKVSGSKADGYTIGTMTGLTVSAWASATWLPASQQPHRHCDSPVVGFHVLRTQGQQVQDLPGSARLCQSQSRQGPGLPPRASVLWTTSRCASTAPRATRWSTCRSRNRRSATSLPSWRPHGGLVRGTRRRRAIPRIRTVATAGRVCAEAPSRIQGHSGKQRVWAR